MQIKWSDKDEILVALQGSTKTEKYTLTAGAGTTNGTFSTATPLETGAT
ncbi:MAG: hypothetical protein RSC07_00420 [Mucinivorans sp.]